MNNLASKSKEEKQIWINKDYTMFTDIISRLKMGKTVYLRLVNSKKNNKDKEEENPFWI